MIYLDHQASTPTDPRVVEAMRPFWEDSAGNPHSAGHAPGRRAADAVERARAQVAALIGAQPAEIVFTSGATEANNLAIKGAARHAVRTGDERRRLVTVATEHPCVAESFAALRDEGFEVVVLPVGADGLLDPAMLDAALAGQPTLLVSAMAAHNETGVLHDLPALAAVARAHGALFHTDAAQAAGAVPVAAERDGFDLVSVSGHKMGGPKGVGALRVRRRPRLRLEPLFSGGGQERGLRSGTVPVPLAVGLGEACRIARAEMEANAARMGALRDRLHALLHARIPGLALNGHPTRRLPGNLNLRFPGVRAADLLADCSLVAASTGSACASDGVAPSPSLLAMGLDAAAATGSLRLSVGRSTSAAEIERAAAALAQSWSRVRHAAAVGRMDAATACLT